MLVRPFWHSQFGAGKISGAPVHAERVQRQHIYLIHVLQKARRSDFFQFKLLIALLALLQARKGRVTKKIGGQAAAAAVMTQPRSRSKECGISRDKDEADRIESRRKRVLWSMACIVPWLNYLTEKEIVAMDTAMCERYERKLYLETFSNLELPEALRTFTEAKNFGWLRWLKRRNSKLSNFKLTVNDRGTVTSDPNEVLWALVHEKEEELATFYAQRNVVKDVIIGARRTKSGRMRKKRGEGTMETELSTLNKACANGYVDVVKVLVASGANLNELNQYGKSPLCVAATMGHTEVVRTLLGSGAIVGWALSWASKQGFSSTVQALLEAGADANEASANWAPLLIASHYGYLSSVEALLANGANVNKSGHHDMTSLMWAASNGHPKTVQALLAAGADVNAVDRHGRHALCWASYCGHFDVFQILIDAGSDIDLGDCFGWTVLSWITFDGTTESAQLVLDAGADPNKRDHQGRTVLSWAAMEGFVGMVKVLLAAGADPDVRDDNGMTPLSLAEQEGNVKTMKLLQKGGGREPPITNTP